MVDHAHTESCIVIGCDLAQPRRKMNMYISGRSCITVAVTVVNTKSHDVAWRRTIVAVEVTVRGVGTISTLREQTFYESRPMH